MSDAIIAFKGETQLLAWSETSKRGATITLQLANPDDLEKFKAMTLAKGRMAGQRLMTVMVEIGDDEKPVEQPASQPKEKPGPLCVMACNFCEDPLFWKWVDTNSAWYCSSADDAKHFILHMSNIKSRKELDANLVPAGIFHRSIREPFLAWKAKQ